MIYVWVYIESTTRKLLEVFIEFIEYYEMYEYVNMQTWASDVTLRYSQKCFKMLTDVTLQFQPLPKTINLFLIGLDIETPIIMLGGMKQLKWVLSLLYQMKQLRWVVYVLFQTLISYIIHGMKG